MPQRGHGDDRIGDGDNCVVLGNSSHDDGDKKMMISHLSEAMVMIVLIKVHQLW